MSMRRVLHSVRKNWKGYAPLMLPVCALLIFGALEWREAGFVSHEVTFTDPSTTGFSIMPASCSSHPSYFHNALPATSDSGGFITSSGQTEYGASRHGVWICITNSGSNYFIPANTAVELASFKAAGNGGKGNPGRFASVTSSGGGGTAPNGGAGGAGITTSGTNGSAGSIPGGGGSGGCQTTCPAGIGGGGGGSGGYAKRTYTSGQLSVGSQMAVTIGNGGSGGSGTNSGGAGARGECRMVWNSGSQTFPASGTFTVPTFTTLQVECWGGGGGGGGDGSGADGGNGTASTFQTLSAGGGGGGGDGLDATSASGGSGGTTSESGTLPGVQVW